MASTSVTPRLRCKSRRSRRMRVAQRFSAGNRAVIEPSPRSGRMKKGLHSWAFSAVRFADCEFTCEPPSAKALGYSHSVRFADAANRLLQQSITPKALFTLLLTLTLATYANAEMRLVDSGSGLNRTVTVESKGLLRLVFEAADNWGIAQWYDLVNDPSARTNLTGPGYGVTKDISTAEPGLFQEVFYGTTPNDPKLYTRAASHYFPKSPRAFNILESSPSRVVVQTISSPVATAVGVLSNVTCDVTYYIYPDGKIYIHSILRVVNAQTVSEWRCAALGLSDPTSAEPYTGPDATGWIRSSATQNPYEYAAAPEKYIFAYWRASTTKAPYTNFTKASVLLIPNPKNKNQGTQGRHNWAGWKRWYYGNVSLNLAAGQSVTQDYLIQLGTQGSSVLPDINSGAVADRIARSYFANPTPPPSTPPRR